MIREWLSEEITIEEAEKDFLVLGFAPDEKWRHFISGMRGGDQLYWFSNTPAFGDPSTDEAGYAIVRQGRIIGTYPLTIKWEPIRLQ